MMTDFLWFCGIFVVTLVLVFVGVYIGSKFYE
jgi:putative Mn2+ efflux pump MntP